MTFEFSLGFRRCWENNRELVGGNYPAEADEWGFRDGSSFTQLRTANGLLQWVDLARGGQRITFTDLRENPPRRYLLQDPPSNKLVEVPSPAAQNPDTGAAIGTVSHGGGGVPIPRVPQPSDGDLPATMTLPSGLLVFEPTRLPDGAVLAGAGIGQTILLRKPGSRGPLLSGKYREIRALEIDGNAGNVASAGLCEIDMAAEGNRVRRVRVGNFRDLGIGATSASGLLEDFEIAGSSPGGGSNVSYMGLHAGENCRSLTVRRGKISGCSANGIFYDGDGGQFEDIALTNNHRSAFPYGGGQVDLSAKSRNATMLRVNCNGSDGPVASGYELNGVNHTLTECGATGHNDRA